jgi:hypothetical protein
MRAELCSDPPRLQLAPEDRLRVGRDQIDDHLKLRRAGLVEQAEASIVRDGGREQPQLDARRRRKVDLAVADREADPVDGRGYGSRHAATVARVGVSISQVARLQGMTDEERRALLGDEIIAHIREVVDAAPEPDAETVDKLRRLLARPANRESAAHRPAEGSSA